MWNAWSKISNCSRRSTNTAASVAVEFGEDDPGYADPLLERGGARERILSGHGVNDQVDLVGIDGGVDLPQFAHERVVDVQTACGVDDEYVDALCRCPFHGIENHARCITAFGTSDDRNADRGGGGLHR